MIMDFFAEEKGKAHEILRDMKKREQKLKLIPIKVARNTFVMMSPNATREEIQAKIKLYNKK